ncbi:MAG: Gfo/Idh/MocA family oxidoreductase, partial [Erysipelotrichaceae bacterium]|nr:Gfo/Idh/MocA family oxidoreductase [Erysipelotrichaceae bacterium]
MKRLKLGIIGFGKQGSYYARKYLETDACKEIELVAVSDNNKARIDWAKGHIENITFFDDAIAMLDSGLIEACQIVIANKEHYRFIHECLIRGIHVLCEKPLCLNTYEARSTIAEAKKHPDLVFGLMLNQRMNPLYRRLKELIDNKTYGKVLRINWTITDWYRSQAYFNNNYWHGTWIGEGGGVLINQAIHQLDLWQWLFGLPAKIESKLCIGKA